MQPCTGEAWVNFNECKQASNDGRASELCSWFNWSGWRRGRSALIGILEGGLKWGLRSGCFIFFYSFLQELPLVYFMSFVFYGSCGVSETSFEKTDHVCLIHPVVGWDRTCLYRFNPWNHQKRNSAEVFTLELRRSGDRPDCLLLHQRLFVERNDGVASEGTEASLDMVTELV